jgi:O-acetyl-ADP-ribose deacetylase (regulator of RNase III)
MAAPIFFNENNNSLHMLIGERQLAVHNGDILDVECDAIVCPVDQDLSLKSGLAKVINNAAGRQLNLQRPLSPVPYGKVVVLPGGRLKTKYIFMTVLLGEKGMDKIKVSIGQAVERAIRYAEFMRLKSIAFPVLGCPDATPPYHLIAHEMIQYVAQYFQRRHTKLKGILVSAYNKDAFKALTDEAKDLV